MDSSPPAFTTLPPPPPNPNPNNFPTFHHHPQNPDLNTTLSTLKHLIHLSKTSIHSLSHTLPSTPTATSTATATATCPYNPNHRLPPAALFRHHLRCPSPIDDLPSPLHYPNSLHNQTITPHLTTNNSDDANIISLRDYHTSLDPNFFYLDSPAVVTFPFPPHHNNNNAPHPILTLPDVILGDDDVTHTFDGGLCKLLLPSERFNVGMEVKQWSGYPSFYSYSVARLIVLLRQKKEDSVMDWVMDWVLVSSPSYGGVVIDVFMRDHMLLLFRICFKAIAREATRHLVSVSKLSKPEAISCRFFECPVLVRVLTWLGSQFGILYGEMNGKLFTINMFKQFLLNDDLLKSLMLFDDESSSLSDLNNIGETETRNGGEDSDGNGKRTVLVSQVAAAVAALHERSALEARIKAIRASCFVPVYQRVQEHEYISKKADEERRKRPNYRPIIEHDGVLWHRGGNQDSNKNKSQEELLAEERDYKRRRMSYRGKKMKRSTTQVMRDIIDEYMQEIKHANMSGQLLPDATDLALVPSSISNLHADQRRHDDIKKNSLSKEPVSDISVRSAGYEDEAKEKNNKNRHKDYRSSKRTKGHSSSPNNGQKSKHKDKGLSSIIENEFEDRYNPSESHDIDA